MRDIVLWSGIFTPSPPKQQQLSTANFVLPQLQRPMASYQLAHWLRANRFSVQVVEFVQLLSPQELIELTEPYVTSKTVAIGLSTVFWPTNGEIPPNVLIALDYFRSKYPNLKVIAGGGRVTREEYTSLDLDQVFLHEAEDSLLKWMQEQKMKLSLPNARFDITHLNHRFSVDDVILESESLPIELGRGCIFKCKFCNYINIGKKKHTYQRQFDLIVDEMKFNKDAFGTTNYIFLDDTCNEDPDKVRNLSTLPDRLGFNIGWVGYLRADLIWSSDEAPELLLQSGLSSAYFGLESLHPQASALIGKGWCGKHARDFIPHLYHNLWHGKVNMFSNFILGLPHETEDSFRQTLEWCKQTDVGHFNFFPLVLKHSHEAEATKSEFDKNSAAYGYDVGPNGDWSNNKMSFQGCAKIASEFNAVLAPNNRVSGFATSNYLNLGLTLEEIQRLKVIDGIKIIRERMDAFKSRYVSKYKEMIK